MLKSGSSSDLQLEPIQGNSGLKTHLLSGSSSSNYESITSNSTSSQQESNENAAIIIKEGKTETDRQNQDPEQPPNIVQEEHKYPEMHRYITENNLGFTYDDILKHDEGETKILGDLFEIFKQEIYQDNKEPNSRCSQERLYRPWMKWSWVDQFAEKILQSPVIWLADLHPETKEKCKPVWKAERSILLSTVLGLEKANFVRGFVQGIELGLFKSVHYFIYAMLAYRFVSFLQPGLGDFVEFKEVFGDSEQKGIDSLVRTLAKVDSGWLKLILTTPLIIGIIQGLSNINFLGESDITVDRMTAHKITIKGLKANNITGQNTYIDKIGISSEEFAIQGLCTGEEDNQTSEIKMDEEKKVTVSKAKLKEMKVDKLSSNAVTTFDEMTSINIKYELETTNTGMSLKTVEAKDITAKKVNVAKGKLIAKRLTAKEIKMDRMSGSIEIVASKLKKTEFAAEAHMTEPGGFCRDVLQESVPVVSSLFSLSNQIQQLEYAVRWDGRLTVENRKRAFEIIRNVAKKGKKVTQLNAIESLTKIAHGVGFKDLPRLKKAGYPSETLALILYIKARALADLRLLVGAVTPDEKKEHNEIKQESISLYEKMKNIAKDISKSTLSRRIYTYYLLWWLGHSVVWWNRPLFLSLKAAKLGLELYFLSKIVESIQEAINCPDKRGFKLGFGYPEWATELTTGCFNQYIDQFRTVNLSDSVQTLVEQINLFHLNDLKNFQLQYKNLTGSEMVAILDGITNRGAELSKLYIYDHFADVDMQIFSAYLKTSAIQVLELGCIDYEYPGGEFLTNQGMQYLINVLPYTKLTSLWLCFPKVDSLAYIALANILNSTDISKFYVPTSNMDDSGAEYLLKVLSTMKMQRIMLSGDKVGDQTINYFTDVVKNSPNLTEIWIEGNFITDKGATTFANIIRNSYLDTVGVLGNNITDEGVISLANSFATIPLKQLTLKTHTGEEGIIELANILNQTQIWWFTLWGNEFTVNSASALSRNLPSSQVRHFDLIDNNLDENAFKILVDGISSSLIDFFLIWKNDLSQGLQYLIPAMSQLIEFTCVECNLTDNSIQLLAPYLVNSPMRSISFFNNSISDNGVSSLVKVLPRSSVTELNLSYNFLTNEGAIAFANIYHSTPLQRLNLIGNGISDSLLYEVESFRWKEFCQNELCYSDTTWFNNSNKSFSISSYYLPDSLLKKEAPLSVSTVSAAILGTIGAGILVYKNITWIKRIVDNSVSCISKNYSDCVNLASAIIGPFKITAQEKIRNLRFSIFASLSAPSKNTSEDRIILTP